MQGQAFVPALCSYSQRSASIQSTASTASTKSTYHPQRCSVSLFFPAAEVVHGFLVHDVAQAQQPHQIGDSHGAIGHI